MAEVKEGSPATLEYKVDIDTEWLQNLQEYYADMAWSPLLLNLIMYGSPA